MAMREFIEPVKAVGIFKVMHVAAAIILFAAGLYLRWKYAAGFPPL